MRKFLIAAALIAAAVVMGLYAHTVSAEYDHYPPENSQGSEDPEVCGYNSALPANDPDCQFPTTTLETTTTWPSTTSTLPDTAPSSTSLVTTSTSPSSTSFPLPSSTTSSTTLMVLPETPPSTSPLVSVDTPPAPPTTTCIGPQCPSLPVTGLQSLPGWLIPVALGAVFLGGILTMATRRKAVTR